MADCPLYGEDCKNELHELCREIVLKYSKVVWCRDSKCLWNFELESGQGKVIKHHIDYVSLGKADEYRGICSRPEIGLSHKNFTTNDSNANSRHFEVATCDVRSNKKIKGHLDWSKLTGPQSGGNIPDPIESFPSASALSDPLAS